VPSDIELIELQPEHRSLAITHTERRFLRELGPLIDTPRAAKRLGNTYRILRAGLGGTTLDTFLGSDNDLGEYRAAALLLAIMAGRPALARPTFEHIMHSSDHDLWSRLVKDLDPKYIGPGDTWTNAIDDQLTDQGSVPWRKFHHELSLVDDRTAAADLEIPERVEVFRRWAPAVARYSFQTRSVLGRPDQIAHRRI
jgi:hypothetical protein